MADKVPDAKLVSTYNQIMLLDDYIDEIDLRKKNKIS